MRNHKSSELIKTNESSSPINTKYPPLFDSLTKEQQNEAIELAMKMDISNMENVLTFGADIQKQLKHFTHNLFVQVQRHNTNSIRETLFQLQKQLEKMDTDQLIQNRGFFSKLFKRTKSPQEVISEYHRLSKTIDRLTIQLQYAHEDLLNDCKKLNHIYEQNKLYFDQLNVYIVAGEMKRQELIEKELPKLEELENSDELIESKKYYDIKNAIEWLDRRIYDMQISREIAIQTAPQIRMIQETNELLLEKIQSSILTTIPLWQSQISMIVNLNKKSNMQQTTNRFDKQLADGLQMTSSDIQQLKETQHSLIDSIEDALVVQAKNNEQQTALEQTMVKAEKFKL